jgi:8-oxo-dGTP pyrophosphatase MutT (NUDIX family)
MNDPGETIEETVARELHEETGLVCEREPDGTPLVEPLFTTASPTDGRPLYVFRVTRYAGTAYAAEPASVVRWMKVSDFFARSVLFRDTIRELMARGLLAPPAGETAAQ